MGFKQIVVEFDEGFSVTVTDSRIRAIYLDGSAKELLKDLLEKKKVRLVTEVPPGLSNPDNAPTSLDLGDDGRVCYLSETGDLVCW